MNTQISSKSESIQIVYDWYRKSKLVVNRRYQRKLVWTLEEKKAFIDSIYQQYSVPLFLLANTQTDGKECYEIIDGMQRLNAICSFIEGVFPIIVNGENRYFDLETLALTKADVDNNKLKQKNPVLDREECISIVSYQLPFSFILYPEQKKIEEIFRRINSFGRQLSKQEIRQAGAIGKFPDLVRRIAAQIRGDSSPSDILNLEQMKEISLSNKALSYGIDMNELFWVKQNIVTVQNMRVSRDEELIACILIYILLDPEVSPSAHSLDKLYKYEINDDYSLANQVEDTINKLGFDNIQTWFNKVFDELASIISKDKDNFRNTLFNKDKGEGLVRVYQVIFLALYELIILDKKRVSNYNGLLNTMKGLGDKHLTDISSKNWDGMYRKEKVLSLKGIFIQYFKDCEKDDVAIENWVSQFENILSHSKIEHPQYDFKIGFFPLVKGSSFEEKLLSKVMKTLTAMVNRKPYDKGYVIIGVADTEDDAKQFNKIYGCNYRRFQHFYITGIQNEITANFSKRDDYMNNLKNLIKKEPVSEDVKSYILGNLKLINYHDKEILILELESGKAPISYADKYYHRQINSVEAIEGASATAALFSRFQ